MRVIDDLNDVRVIDDLNVAPETSNNILSFNKIPLTAETKQILDKYPELHPTHMLQVDGIDFYFSPICNLEGRNMAFAYVEI